MCRLASFPPGFKRKDAIEILSEMEGYNKDGVGYSYIKDGKFIIDKAPYNLDRRMKENKGFLAHMPYNDGWTIAHLRKASHGENLMRNTHPFVVGNWCIVHNGIWSDYDTVKLAYSRLVKFKGETDTEVACHLIKMIGPKSFANNITGAGVFVALHRRGGLWVMKTSGDLEVAGFGKKSLIASELDDDKYSDKVEPSNGWYQFSPEGMPVSFKEKKSAAEEWRERFPSSYSPQNHGGYGGVGSYGRGYGGGGGFSSNIAKPQGGVGCCSTEPKAPETPFQQAGRRDIEDPFWMYRED